MRLAGTPRGTPSRVDAPAVGGLGEVAIRLAVAPESTLRYDRSVARRELPTAAPPTAKASTLRHRVPFFETDAMGIVHHANYVRYLELARVVWLDEHDQPYRAYIAEGLHFATTTLDLRYHRAAVFDDEIEITTWLVCVQGASLRMAYTLRRGGELLATAATQHAMVDTQGRPRRIPASRRGSLQRLQAEGDREDASGEDPPPPFRT